MHQANDVKVIMCYNTDHRLILSIIDKAKQQNRKFLQSKFLRE